MSSAETLVYNALSTSSSIIALVGDRIFSDEIRPNSIFPYIVFYSHISSEPHSTLKGDTGSATVRAQIDCWSDKPDDARALALLVRRAMKTVGQWQDQDDNPQPERKVYVSSLDFTVCEKVAV